MGVDFLICNYCEETFPDCGHFVSCESCGTHWCSDECAAEDGYLVEHCKKYPELNGFDEMYNYRENHCEYKSCCYCENYAPSSCNFCRGEDYSDETLLQKALDILGMSREDLIKKLNDEKTSSF